MAPRVFKSKHRECLVLLPSGEEINCDITDSISGFKLLDIVCEKLNIESDEKHYFGFKYVHKKDGKYSWLNLKKAVGKKLKTSNYHIEFHVQYWPSTPFAVKQDIVRYQMLLETRTKLLNGELSTTLPIQALLTSCLIQAEVGDWKNTAEYSQTFDDEESFKFFPNQPTDFAEQVKLFHERLVGTTQDEAEMMYLESARRLILHGMEMHPALDDNQVSIILGVNCTGISVLQNGFMLNRLLWEQVTKLKRQKHTLFVGLNLGEEGEDAVKVGFHSPTHLDLKRLYRCCCGYLDLSRKRESGFSGKTSVPFTRVDSKRFMKFRLSKRKPTSLSELKSKPPEETTESPKNNEKNDVDEEVQEDETNKEEGVPPLKEIAAEKLPAGSTVSEILSSDEPMDNEHLQQESVNDDLKTDIKDNELKDDIKSDKLLDVTVDDGDKSSANVDREMQRESIIVEVWKEDGKLDIAENDDDNLREEENENVQQDEDTKSKHKEENDLVGDEQRSDGNDCQTAIDKDDLDKDDFENINDIDVQQDDKNETNESYVNDDSQLQTKDSNIDDDFENINGDDVPTYDTHVESVSDEESEDEVIDKELNENENDFENINEVEILQSLREEQSVNEKDDEEGAPLIAVEVAPNGEESESDEGSENEKIDKELNENEDEFEDINEVEILQSLREEKTLNEQVDNEGPQSNAEEVVAPNVDDESESDESDEEKDDEYENIDIVVEQSPQPTKDEVPQPLYRSSYIEDIKEEEEEESHDDNDEDSQRAVEVLSDSGSDVKKDDDDEVVNIDPIQPDQTPNDVVNGDVDHHDNDDDNWDDDDLLVVEAIIEKLDNEANTSKEAVIDDGGSVKVIVNGVHDTDNQHRHSYHEWEGLLSRSFNKSYNEYDDRLMSTVSNMSEVSRMSEQELLESLDLDTVIVETMEYTTEEVDPETSNVCVTTHTYFTEIESSQSMIGVTLNESNKD